MTELPRPLNNNRVPLPQLGRSRQEPDPQLRLPETKSQSWQQLLGSVLHQLRRRELEIELMPFWRFISAPLALVTTVTTALITFGIALFNFGSLPPKIPFYYNAIDSKWEQADKAVLLFSPIAIFIVDLILLRLIYEIFPRDHRLSNMLCWVLSVLNILILTSNAQIYTLIKP